MSRKKTNYTLKEFQEGKIAISVQKESMYNALMKRLEKAGFMLCEGQKPTELKDWNNYKQETCVTYDRMGIEYCSKEWYKDRNYTIIKPHQIKLVEEINKVKPTAKIDSASSFKNKYINLSNKELNGEVTEEVFEKLKQCFEHLGFKTFYFFHSVYLESNFKYVRFKNDVIDDYVSNFDALSQFPSNETSYKELSIYDIKGMPPKITITANTKPTSMHAIEMGDEVVIHTPFIKKLYSIEDLKNNKIAVQCNSVDEEKETISLLRSNEVVFLPSSIVKRKFKKCPRELRYVVLHELYEGSNEYFYDYWYKWEVEGYTIITLDQILGDKPTAEEGYINLKLKTHHTVCLFNDADTVAYIHLNNKKITITKDNFQSIKNFLEGKYNVIKHNCTVFPLILQEHQKVIIKYQGKEKVITREDFEDLDYAEENNVHITSTEMPPGYDSFLIEKGSRAWALLALDRGEKVRHESWEYTKYIFLEEERMYTDKNETVVIPWYKDGWEIYKESKKLITLKEAVLQNKTFNHRGNIYGKEEYAEIIQEILKDSDIIVEIINNE